MAILMECRCRELTELQGNSGSRYIDSHLKPARGARGGWLREYVCPFTDLHWIMDALEGWRQGGGILRLRRIDTLSDADRAALAKIEWEELPGPTLALENITKRFGNLIALENVTVAFKPGRIHGVLGENGAGKSTLMRIAAGLLSPDGGRMWVSMEPRVAHWSAITSKQHGIAMVHQHFMLVPTLTVAENLLLGRRDLGQWRAKRRATVLAVETSRRIGLTIEPSARVETLSVGEQQRVEITRALSVAKRVLILDEPTAVLTPREVDQLFEALRLLRDQGLAIAFISHKLGEVSRICDEVSILRKGRLGFSGPSAGLSVEDMARHMVGSAPAPLPSARTAPRANVALELRDLTAHSQESGRSLTDVRLVARAGEIVGVAGVEGNGQDVLAAAIVGLMQPATGRIFISGVDVTACSVRERADRGLAHIPEDRLRQGLVSGMDLVENLTLRSYRNPPIGSTGFIRWRVAQRRAESLVEEYDVRSPSMATAVGRLSGGNQQKLLLARELSDSPLVILAHNPARGLDIAATRFVFSRLIEQRERGAAILLIHSDLDELLALADRVYVICNGKLVETQWPRTDRDTIGRLMLGEAA